ncbi:MAG: LacI family DNA-binding transcriptional regulator [Flavobacteriaceae bacterium]
MMMKSLKDIAKALDLSVATVSKALKDYKDVSTATKLRVRAYAKEVNFKPNLHAAYLRSQKTKLIGLILPDLNHYFFNSILASIVEEAEQNEYRVLVFCSKESYENEKQQVLDLVQQNVDGIFLSISKSTYQYDHLEEAKKQKIPLILFDRIAKAINSFRVVIDDKKAAFDATSHLIQQGCKKIAHFRGDLIPQMSIDRFFGYKEALKFHGLEFDENLVYICHDNEVFDGSKHAETLLQKHPDVDGLFAITDLVAIGAMNHFIKKGCRIPQDIAVIGFSNWQIASLVTPALSSVEQNGYQIGKKVMSLFLKTQIKGNQELPFTTEVIPSKLIVRASSRRTKI